MLDRSQPITINELPLLTLLPTEELLLDNGVRLVMLDRGEEAVSRITFSWEGGEYEAQNAAAASLLSKTLKDVHPTLSPAQMADLLDCNGAWLAPNLHAHYMSQSLFALNSRLVEILPPLIEIFNAPRFDFDSLRTHRAQFASYKRMTDSRVEAKARQMEAPVIYGPTHPGSREASPDEISAVEIADLESLYDGLYRRRIPTVYVAGKIDGETRHTLVESISRLETDDALRSPIVVTPFATGAASRQSIDVPESLQSAIRITIPAPLRSHPDYNSLRAVVTALGGYFGSRLMKTIREDKGLTYGISAALIGHREGSFITISSQCDNSYTTQVVDETLNEIARLASEPMDQAELSTLKRYMTSVLASTFDTPFTAMDYYLTERHVGTPAGYFYAQQKAIGELTPEKVMEIADRYINRPEKFITIAGKLDS